MPGDLSICGIYRALWDCQHSADQAPRQGQGEKLHGVVMGCQCLECESICSEGLINLSNV